MFQDSHNKITHVKLQPVLQPMNLVLFCLAFENFPSGPYSISKFWGFDKK